MDVRVGSFSDPVGLEGLAHFLGKKYQFFTGISYFFGNLNESVQVFEVFYL